MIRRYVCEVCCSVYDTPGDALACEARGPAPEVPVGTVVVDGPYLHGLQLLQVVACASRDRRHVASVGYWTFRDNAQGRASSIGDSGPASGHSTSGPLLGDEQVAAFDPRRGLRVDLTSARYRRAWEALREAGVPMQLWLHGQAVPAPAPM